MLRTRPSHHRRHSSAASRSMYRDQQAQQRTKPSPSSGSASIGSSNGKPAMMEPRAMIEKEVTLPDSPRASHVPLFSKGDRSTGTDEMDALASGMSALNFVPPSVRFGRGGPRGGFAKS